MSSKNYKTILKISKEANIPSRTLNARARSLGFEKEGNTYFLSPEEESKLLDENLHKRGVKSSQKILRATHDSKKTPLILGEVEIPCYVLEDGSRVLSMQGVLRAIGLSEELMIKHGGKAFPWLITKFQNYISQEVNEKLEEKIYFHRPGAGGAIDKTIGIEASLFIDFCNIIIDARNDNFLSEEEINTIYKNALIITRATSKLGIISLIDEVTGYQDIRYKNALQELLKKFISEELLPWQERFPLEYYKQVFRLKKWDFDHDNFKKRPGYLGEITNRYIYGLLAPGVVEELKLKNPKNLNGHRVHRHHQFLTEDIGHPQLKEQITQFITIAKLSTSWKDFTLKFETVFSDKIKALAKFPVENPAALWGQYSLFKDN